ncbi:hypothetical protein, partial [Xenorhabdus bovienii]|uniref:hypothetical protein n=1 Tax=Xenorhabdus bovienii TaxID=40576 RepID=UPI003DA6781B
FLAECQAFISGLFSRCPPRRVFAQRRSVVAHYRDFLAPDNSYFKKKLSIDYLSSNASQIGALLD